ncbi:MAG: DUF4124 domain-containing protein [Thermodesulfobacteriota bacterium]
MKAVCHAMYLTFLIAVLPAYGQFYKYVDEQGIVRFTDDLDKIPESQRPVSKIYEESKSRAETPAELKPETKETGDDEKESLIELRKKSRELEIKRKQLDSEYKGLMEKKAALQQMNKKTRVELIKYNQEASKLNEQIQAYEEKREAFDKEVDAFNKKVKEKEEAQLKSEKSGSSTKNDQ